VRPSLWQLLPYAASADVCVTVARRKVRSRSGIAVRVSGDLSVRDVRVRGGIRMTSPARTVADLAVELPLDELERLAAEAQRRATAVVAQLAAALTLARHR